MGFSKWSEDGVHFPCKKSISVCTNPRTAFTPCTVGAGAVGIEPPESPPEGAEGVEEPPESPPEGAEGAELPESPPEGAEGVELPPESPPEGGV